MRAATPTKRGTLSPVLRAAIYLAVFVVALYLVAFIISLTAVSVFGAKRPDAPDDAYPYLSVSAPICSISLALVFRRYIDRRSIASLGILPGRGWWQALGFGAILAALLILPSIAWGYVHGSLDFHASLLKQPGASESVSPLSDSLLLIAATVGTNVALRGYVFQNVWEQWGPLPAVIVSTALELLAGFSFQLPGVILVGLSVLYLGFTVLWTRSIWVGLGFSVVWELLGPYSIDSSATFVVATIIAAGLSYFLYRRGLWQTAGGEDYQQARPVRKARASA